MSEQTVRFEQALKQLEEVVKQLEQGELELEESLKLYEEGIRLSRLCHAKLEDAEGRIEMLVKDARGEAARDRKGQPRTQPVPSPDQRTAPDAGEDQPSKAKRRRSLVVGSLAFLPIRSWRESRRCTVAGARFTDSGTAPLR